MFFCKAILDACNFVRQRGRCFMLFLTFPVACNDWGGIKFVLLFADLLYFEVLVKV